MSMVSLDNYNVIGDSLKGGMGQVQHLYHRDWQLDVAYKQPLNDLLQTEEDKAAFYEECERWISLGIHPNIVQCYFFGEENQTPGAFMEWMEQGSLLDYIKSGKLYEGDKRTVLLRILDIGIQMAKGLWYSHKKGILHLDVKPANVLLDKAGNVKITDFGISTLLNKKQRKTSYTLQYCAPEQQREGAVNERTDIYCWGVSLLHMLVRHAIWLDGNVAGMAYDLYLENAVTEVPEALKDLLAQCLTRENEKRIADFKLVIDKMIGIYHSVSSVPYDRNEEQYAGISLDAYSNSAISYYNLGYKEKATVMWRKTYWHNLYHFSSYFNCHLSQYLQGGSLDSQFFDMQLKSVQAKECMNALSGEKLARVKKHWALSIGAYQLVNSTKQIRLLAPKEEWVQNCVLLSWIYDNKILYVGKEGKITIYNRKNPSDIRTYTVNLPEIAYAAVNKDGRYVAMAYEFEQGVMKTLTYALRVIDLENMQYRLEATGNAGAFELRNLSFCEQYEAYPRVIANFGWEIYDWKLNDKLQKFPNSMHESTYQPLVEKMKPPIRYVADVSGYCMAVFGDRKCGVYDVFEQEELSRTLSLHIYDYKIKTIQSIPGENRILLNTEDKGYLVYDYISHALVTQGYSTRGEHKYYRQISLNEEGEVLFMLPDGEVRVAPFPETDARPEPVWEMKPFRTTAALIQDCKQAVDWIKGLDENIDKIYMHKLKVEEKLEKLIVKRLKNIKLYYQNSFRDYYEYLRIAAKTSKVLEPKRISARRIFTDQEIEFARPDVDGIFHCVDMPELTLEATTLGAQLRRNDRVLAEIPHSYNGIIGITKDYCYLVCDNRYDKRYRYQLFQLEWDYEEGMLNYETFV